MIYRIIALQLRLQKNRTIKKNKLRYELLEKLKGGQPQISTTDQDARALLVQGGSS
jgi:hypothetical protein